MDPIHEVFRARTKENPEQTALIHGTRRISYADLDARSDRMAVTLQRRGIGPGDRVPVLLRRSPEFVAVLLAVLKTGAAYAAFDPRWPAERVSRLVRRLDADFVVSEPPAEVGGELEPVRVTGADACCVFFTSGSTGEPKAVLVPHAGTTTQFVGCPFADFGPDTVMPQAAPLPWDGLTLELWAPLLNGGTVVLVDDPYLNPPLLRSLIGRHGVNIAWFTASIFNLAIEEDPRCFAGLRQVLVGGERLSVRHVARFLAEHPRIPLLNGYGPVECTVFVSTHRVRPEDVADPDGIPVGRPVPGTEIMVLDGEICVAGERLALAYVGDPVATAEKFVYVEGESGPVRVYRTGDVGRLRADGVLSVRGRIDRQVKIRGHRVEPGEVEHAIMAVAGVVRAVVEPIRDQDGAVTGLLGFYTGGVAPERLRAALRDRLPGYLVPTELRQVEEFPYTPSGKIDHAALGAPPPAPSPAGDAVTAVFAELLGIDAVPPDVSFFALGGDSLAAGRACVRLGVSLSRFMRDPTVRGVAAAVPIEVAEPVHGNRIPLSPWQRAFWTAQRLRPESVSGHCPMLWWVTGSLDIGALRAALADVHDRHEALRARYVLDGEPVAVLDDPVEAVLLELPDGADPDAVEAAVLGELDRPLDLAEGRVWRAVVQRCGDRCLVGLVVHHIAIDGRSEPLLAADLSVAYRARVAGVAPGFPEPAPGLARVSRPGLASPAALGRLRPLELPVEVVPVAGRERMAVGEVAVDDSTWQRLGALARDSATTLVVPALVAWARVLRDATGRADFGIGLPVDRRTVAGAVGCFVGMCCVPAAELLVGDLRAAAAAVHDVVAGQEVPPWTGPAPYQTILAVQQHDPPQLSLVGCDTVHSRPAAPEPICDLQMELWLHRDSVPVVRLTTDASRVPDWFAATLLDSYRTTLAGPR